jgi:hypothetical protein
MLDIIVPVSPRTNGCPEKPGAPQAELAIIPHSRRPTLRRQAWPSEGDYGSEREDIRSIGAFSFSSCRIACGSFITLSALRVLTREG